MTNPISFPWIRRPSSKRLSNSWPATATSKRHGPGWPSPGERPAEIFFSASFSLPREKLPYPALLFDGQLKTRQAPGTSFEPYPIPVLGDPKKLVQALDTLRDLKSFPSPAAVNTTTGPQLRKYASAAFGSLDPWKPGHLRSAYLRRLAVQFLNGLDR